MIDGIRCMRSKTNLYRQQLSPEILRSFSTELERYSSRLSTLILSPARDLDNLLSYLTASFSSISPHFLPETPTEPPIESPSSDPTTTTANNAKDLNYFKFGPSIVLAYPCDMIASNGRSILSYVVEKNFLNYSTITGGNLSSIKVYRLLAPLTGTNARLWDITWCPWSQFYVM